MLTKNKELIDKNIRYVKGIGPKKEKLFNKIGIFTVSDLLRYFPRNYQDRRFITPITQINPNDTFLIKGIVKRKNLRQTKPGFVKRGKNTILEIAISDDTGFCYCVWFNQGYLADKIKVDDQIFAFGKVSFFRGKLQMSSPDFEIIEGPNQDTQFSKKILPVYRLTKGLSQKLFCKTINLCLQKTLKSCQDPIPFNIREQNCLPDIEKSLKDIHFPQKLEEAEKARQRFIFEELFLSQILVGLRKIRYRQRKGTQCEISQKLFQKIRDNLGFQLTEAQKKAVDEILSDMKKPNPMHRLLQGDVGCGKTIVCAFSVAVSVSNGFQSAVMVPTEVLANQHKESFSRIFKGLGFTIELLTSSCTKKKKDAIISKLENGEIDIIVGTHALLEEDIKFKNLGLVVIDEQHKFGVGQRLLLPKKRKDLVPDCLVMSATPIPRSLALSLYGDLDLTVINQMPKGRKIPKTVWVGEDKRNEIYSFVKDVLNQGRQVYVVYPVIEEALDWDLKSVNEMVDVLKSEFCQFNLGVFHGRMKTKEKTEVVNKFINKKIDILVSTTVIEVGVNIENATIMIVENPERFGLAQLHQLRGRIRRSTYQPHFILISKDNLSEISRKRLEVISTVNDGFEIAEKDLLFRGPGDFFGNIQSGYPDLKIANPLRDIEILKDARDTALALVGDDPDLTKDENQCIRNSIDKEIDL